MTALTTPVTLPPSPPRLAYGQVGLSFGSCFSERIAQRLQAGGLDLLANPFGIQYNPLSIASGLEHLLSGRDFDAEDLVEREGRWHSFAHHGRFSTEDQLSTLSRIRSARRLASDLLARADYLLLTWGTAYVYRLADPALGTVGAVVNNCHKFPEKHFSRARVTTAELLAVWEPLLDRLFARRPQLQLIQTVSPIRHLRDGAHANALSKATLLLFAEALAERYSERIHYFPTYEIVLDELRDYRFYGEDMTHPSTLTEQLLWERFVAWGVEAETQGGLEAFARYRREEAHRPLHTSPQALAQREEQLALKRAALGVRYPHALFTPHPLWID